MPYVQSPMMEKDVYPEQTLKQPKETDLENLLSQFEKYNSESESLSSRLESLSEKLRSGEIVTDPENPQKTQQSGLISRLNTLLNMYQRIISRNQNAVSKIESII